MGASAKSSKLPVKVVARAKAVVAPGRPLRPRPGQPVVKAQPSERKAKLVAALKRLHPMD